MDPETTLDKPKNEDHYNKMAALAEAFKKIVIGTLKAQDLATAENPTANTPGHDDRFENNTSWGPKTTAVPEDPLEGNVHELVNLGPDIPVEYQALVLTIFYHITKAYPIKALCCIACTCSLATFHCIL